ncbi:hypothetical protein LTR95_000849 [Oleoguttula sp. CCFEE 5521]
MPKPKKIAPKDPKQTRLVLARPTPGITRMISQYGMLAELCKHISSADVVHLAATCREHHGYITSNPALFKSFLGSGHCDSSGLMAQHKIFGHPHPDSTSSMRTPAMTKALDRGMNQSASYAL